MKKNVLKSCRQQQLITTKGFHEFTCNLDASPHSDIFLLQPDRGSGKKKEEEEEEKEKKKKEEDEED